VSRLPVMVMSPDRSARGSLQADGAKRMGQHTTGAHSVHPATPANPPGLVDRAARADLVAAAGGVSNLSDLAWLLRLLRRRQVSGSVTEERG